MCKKQELGVGSRRWIPANAVRGQKLQKILPRHTGPIGRRKRPGFHGEEFLLHVSESVGDLKVFGPFLRKFVPMAGGQQILEPQRVAEFHDGLGQEHISKAPSAILIKN